MKGPLRSWQGAGIALVALLTLAPSSVPACMWVHGTSIDGTSKRAAGSRPERDLERALASTPEQSLMRILDNLEPERAVAFTPREAEGVEQVIDGRYAEAIETFLAIEADHPGNYSTAANLGTAYELHGDLELALRWISEGIRRNGESHYGTEWLHVAILKAKIELAKDPGYLDTHRIIPLPESIAEDTVVEVEGRPRSLVELERALGYQLGERMVFVKPEDPVVADLLFSYGRMTASTHLVESGLELLGLSGRYGFADPAMLAAETSRYERLILLRKVRFAGWITLGVVAFVAFVVVAVRRKWIFLTNRSFRSHRAAQASDR